MHPDYFTSTVDAAAAYEQARGEAEDVDDRPTRLELLRDAWLDEHEESEP